MVCAPGDEASTRSAGAPASGPIAETSVSRPVGTNRKNVPMKNSSCERTGMVRMNCEPLDQSGHFTGPSLPARCPDDSAVGGGSYGFGSPLTTRSAFS